MPVTLVPIYELMLTAITEEEPGHGGIWSMSFDTGPIKSEFAIKPRYGDSDTMLCTLGFPGTLPGGLSQAFPFINKKPPAGRERMIFTSDAPEGKPHEEDATSSSGIYYKVAAGLLLALCVVLLGHLFWQKKKQRKVSQALKAQLEEEQSNKARNIPHYSDDV
jgi:hypothetical protein